LWHWLQHHPNDPQQLQLLISVILDFEAALWSAISEIIPDIRIRDGHFHWSQAICRKVQDVGLPVVYGEDEKNT